MQYQATLPEEDGLLFVRQFAISSLRKMANIFSTPVKGQPELMVTITPTPGAEETVDAAFKSGSFRQTGWSGKFKKIRA
jgi:hypothetical protein